jgi:hypothetical protein
MSEKAGCAAPRANQYLITLTALFGDDALTCAQFRYPQYRKRLWRVQEIAPGTWTVYISPGDVKPPRPAGRNYCHSEPSS